MDRRVTKLGCLLALSLIPVASWTGTPSLNLAQSPALKLQGGQSRVNEAAAEADTAAIKRVFADFSESFSRHDANATAMTFAEDADFTNMRGVSRHGRKEIQDWFVSLYAGSQKAARRTDTVKSVRFFTPDVASVDADSVISGSLAADGSEIPPRKGLMIALVTKQNGRWLIGVFHEAEFPPAAAAPAAK
jgi:uncharacterized protein (TIGR02246 family)